MPTPIRNIDANTLLYDRTPTETVTETATTNAGVAAHGYIGPDGPLRNGFNSDSTGNRLQAGATYYGAMEMSGNLWEVCVGLSENALLFTTEMGDGNLNTNGDCDAPFGEVTFGCLRGGGLMSGVISGFRDLAISDRYYIHLPATQRRSTSGGRGVLNAQ